ncbi:sugar kinase [Sphingobacterium griseoflavum]|uniref:2-dehydro-3-deoxygluconokinase n=1 Tax=Sphingobacterium griseoflavum TaxID=1474952 RepID=A0ABQ3HXA4_9SPHI|nr:sugar kinase [Sphingobacterium griseoflavum]GHE29701.1 2-dehydro-3-deoxygluconokinase [Sphingobacterium griseoflavum]
MKNGKVLSFGEILLRICPDITTDWVASGQLPFYIGGAELNVATALSHWGLPSAYLSAMPSNAISKDIAHHLESRGLDLEAMRWQGDRIGIYYLPKGKDVKHAGVVYDRAGSAFAQLRRADMDWDAIFNGVSWFHFSAICPAINEEIAAICLEALQVATDKGITISLDLNYRAKLWQYGKSPLEVMPDLASYCQVIMGNIWAAQLMLGTDLDDQFHVSQSEYPKEALLAQAERSSAALLARYERCRYVANTFRFDYLEKGIKYYTCLYGEDRLLVSNAYISETIVDKVGSGDCFMAGLIYGLYQEHSASDTLEFATAAAYDKLFIPSDATVSSVSDIEKRIKK